jgi:chaperone modulatory protein CbpM
MLDLQSVLEAVPGLSEGRLRLWIEEGLVRPELTGAAVRFREIDLARLRLLVSLGSDLALDDEAVPVVIGLLDQMHGLRHALRALGQAVGRQPEAVQVRIRAAVAELMRDDGGR